MSRKTTPTYVLLNQITLAASTTTLTLSNIPQNYGDLVLVIAGSGARQFRLNPNGDTGNASLVYMDGYGSTTSSGTVSQISLWYAPSLGPFTSVNQIMDYSASDKHKTVLTRGSVPADVASAYASRWASTAPITSLSLVNASTGSLAAGSVISLYGVHA